jgi:lambda family phage portal protein
MPILELDGAKRASSDLWLKRAGKRNMSPQNTPAVIGSNFGFGGQGFNAAKFNRLTQDFIASQRSADQDLFGDNIRLRSRARKLAGDNPFARKFLQMVVQNVVGPQGVLMRPKVVSVNGKETAQTKAINERIAEAWKKWTKKGRCTADGRFDFIRLQQLAIKNVAREGENLVKDVLGRQFNDCGYALQPLDNDQLDDTMMQALGDGAQIRMGVEVDQYRKPLAYHLYTGHPYDIMPGSRERKRVPAELVTHSAVWERPGQTRGYTWMAAAILDLNMHDGYKEAVLVAARASAAKFATIEKDYYEGYAGEDEDIEGNDENADDTELMTANPGEMLNLDMGEHLNFTDPRFPTSTTKDFTQTILRSIASGLCVQYPSLANDLEGVNFSSIRAGLVDERDMWRVIQAWFIVDFLEPIYLKWLKMALLTTLADITLTPDQMEMVEWRPRGWEWVDPLKDADATVLKLGEGLSTFEIECGNRGLDWREVADQRAREQEYFNEKGVQFGVDITGDQAGKGVAAGAEADVQDDAKAGATNTDNPAKSGGKSNAKGTGK